MKALKLDVALVLILQFTLLRMRVSGGKLGTVYEPDMFRNVSTLISSKGYPVEEHTAQTTDGYLLSMQRIPYGRESDPARLKKRVVFLQHGIFRTSADWVLNFPGQSLGFILADAGYDVWMGNTRGSTYSKKHLNYSTDQPEFWNFSFDEMAQFDLPAMIDYVLSVTAEDKLYYIGHSQGTTVAFALLSESPKYNEKIRLFIALAPVITVGHMTTPVRYLSPFSNTIEFLLNSMQIYEMFPRNELSSKLDLLCQSGANFICESIIASIYGNDRNHLNKTRLGVYTAFSSGSSTKSLAHFGQMINSKQFTKYDYRKEGNMKHYNQPTPPEYDLTRITAPVALIWGMDDRLVSDEDISSLLQSKLKTVVFSYQVDYNHIAFCVALDAATLVYDPILSLLTKY